MKHKIKAVYTIVVLLTAFGTAEAQSAKPRIASRDVVRECMDADDTLLSRKIKIDANAREDTLALAEAQSANSQLNEMHSQLNTSDASAVDAFNQKRTAQNEKAAAINARIDAHASEVESYNADSQAYNKKCAAVKMRIHDRRKVIKERANKTLSEDASKTKQD